MKDVKSLLLPPYTLIHLYTKKSPKTAIFVIKIYIMPVYRLAVPFVALLLAGIYLTYNVDTSWSLLIIGAMVVLVGGFILSPQINWWWWQRFPPDLPPGIHGLLERWPHYRALSKSDRREFRRRMFMFNEGTNFMPQGTDNIPLDARVMIAIAPVTMALGETARPKSAAS